MESSEYGISKHVMILVTPAYQSRIAGIARYARQHSWQLTILDRLARQPRGWKGDGALVTMRSNPAIVDFVKSLKRHGIPVVDLSLNHPEIKVPRVSGDHFAMGRLARAHFAERNYRNLAWFSTNWLNVHRLRYDGFVAGGEGEVMRWVFEEEVEPSHLDDYTLFEQWLAAKIRSAPRPLGLLAYDDADAARALGACLSAGFSIPEDVAIMGIGGDRLVCENQSVPITSVEHDQGRTGYEGAELLDSLMNGAKPPSAPILIPPRGITVRESTDFIAAKSPIVRKALEYIRTNLDQSFGLTQVADAIGKPRSTLNRIFTAELGRTIGEETLRQRLERAKKLITMHAYSMAEIAYKTGFCTPAHFTNTFKAATGRTPKEWQSARTA